MDGSDFEAAERPVEPLTRREREILALLADNLSNREIADRLTLALSSVKWYAQQIYGKLGVSDRREAITRARELGLLGVSQAQPRPTGTVTFILTDIEGSTQLWENHPKAMRGAFARQETIIREIMTAHAGYVYKMVGDSFQVAFDTAPAALSAALAAQRALYAQPWDEIGMLRVRMVLHTGVTEERGDDYVGPAFNRAARLLGAGHGGQILLSQSTYELVRDHLPEGVVLRDLGEHSLKDLIYPEHIYQMVVSDLPEDFPPLRVADARLAYLPQQTMPFVGREAELAKIEVLLNDPECRMISLVGIGGSGKTRLSIQAASQAQRFPQGVYFVALAAITTLDDMVSAIAETLRMPFQVTPGYILPFSEAQAQLFRYLADKKVLLVLDNFEQLTSYVGFLTDLLSAAGYAKLIVSSRERLNLPGEWVLEISGLPFPGSREKETIPQYAAVQLFVKVAERTSHFRPGASDWPAIARICQLVEGMPLGVEMAAAWVKVLSCQEIAVEIERDLDFLAATWRGMPERHRTLRAVFDHSWRLLVEEERRIFCRLSIFRSGFNREAALEIGGTSLPMLSALIDKSFLHRNSSGRYEIHPVLKQYGIEMLAEDSILYAETRCRHARYYSDWLCRMYEKLKGSEQMDALTALRSETQNLRDAWQWLIDHFDFERIHQVLPAVILFYEMHDQPIEAQEVAHQLLDMLRALKPGPGAQPLLEKMTDEFYNSLLALVLAALRHFSIDSTHMERFIPYELESLQVAQGLPDGHEKAYTIMLNCIGPATLEPPTALDLLRQCIAIFQDTGDAWGTAMAQLILADIVSWHGLDIELGRATYQLSLEAFSRMGNEWGRGLCLTGLAHIEEQAGNLKEAYPLYNQSLDICIRMDEMSRMLYNRHALGEIAEWLGDLDDAHRHFKVNLAYALQLGDERQQRYYLERLAKLGKPGHHESSRLSPLSPPFRAVIFDLDGLMVNTEHLVFKAYQQLLEPHGLSLSEADARAMLGLDIEDTARYVIDKTGYPGSLADLTETHYRRWLQVIDGELEPVPGLLPLIDYLERSGYKLAVASNSPLEYVNHILRAICLSSHFAVVVGRDQVASGKPGPDLYQMAAHWLGISPSQCLALEDSPVGMQSALAAGITCVVISPEAFTEPQFAAAHARYSSLIELLDDIDAIFVR